MKKALTEKDVLNNDFPDWELPQLPLNSKWRIALALESGIGHLHSFHEEFEGAVIYAQVLAIIESFGLPHVGDYIETDGESLKVIGRNFDPELNVVKLVISF